jgi:transposase-like protein
MRQNWAQKRQLKAREFRYFSEDFRKEKVREIEKGIATVSEVSRAYSVSLTAIYKWIYRYSMERKKGVRLVVEKRSETTKLLELKERLRELEQIIGQKQLLIDFQEKLLELASDEVGFDLKKKYGSKLKVGSGKIGKKSKRA